MTEKKDKLSPAVVFDLDGCLFESKWRIHPIALKTLRLWEERNIKIIILTARWPLLRFYTRKRLNHYKIQMEKLIFWNHLWGTAWGFKYRQMKRLITEYKIIMAYDDHPRICARYHQLGVPFTEIKELSYWKEIFETLQNQLLGNSNSVQ
ncbi:MAG: HAD hydrolase family protein [Promethearchaeota archaeon]